MSVYVFTGPTISSAEASRVLEAVYLPPAAEGDVYRVALTRPQAIGIIDGYFQSVPAVRHKEILWTMSQGIHVFGSASMGALRAAELAAFGMEGVGTIFESYRDGILEDDDEVAIAHGPAEVGFRARSEAMVNIRQTLRKAERVGTISNELRAALEKIGKELFYPDRNYRALLRLASERGLPEADLEGFRQWLPEGRVNQKREDALRMLRLIRRRLSERFKPKIVSYVFEHTAMWESVWRKSGDLRFDSDAQPRSVDLEATLDELRLEGNQYKQHSLAALERVYAIREAERLGVTVSNQSRRKTEQAFRQEHRLTKDAKLERWMKENALSHSEFDALMSDEARLTWFRRRNQFISVSCLPEHLRLSNDYSRLLARACAKDLLLQSFGLKNPRLQDANLTENELVRWYFKELLRQPMPDDPNSYARNSGFASPHAFRRALLKEYLYRRLEDQTRRMAIPSRRLARRDRRVFPNADRSGSDRTSDRARSAQE